MGQAGEPLSRTAEHGTDGLGPRAPDHESHERPTPGHTGKATSARMPPLRVSAFGAHPFFRSLFKLLVTIIVVWLVVSAAFVLLGLTGDAGESGVGALPAL